MNTRCLKSSMGELIMTSVFTFVLKHVGLVAENVPVDTNSISKVYGIYKRGLSVKF